jgi:hypothetical protein
MLNVSILSADNVTAATTHGCVTNALNVERVDPHSDVEHISAELAEQIRRVQVDGVYPAETPAGGAEVAVVRQRGEPVCTRTVSGNDLRLHRDRLKELLGDVNVLGLHWKHYQPVARLAVFARAFWLQQELGLGGDEALLHALRQIYGITRELLAVVRPKLLTRIANKLPQAKWGIDLSKDRPDERYPLTGVSGRDARPLYREIDDLVIAECRKVAPEQRLLTEVLNESSAPLVVAFAGDEDLPFLPGVSVDWLKMAHAAVAPRPNVGYVAEQLVFLRMANDAESLEMLEGFNPKAGALAWGAVVAGLKAAAPKPVALRAWSIPRRPAIAAAIALPVVVALMAIFGGFTAAMATLGLVAAVLLEAVFLTFADRTPAPKRPAAKPVPAPAAPAKAAAPAVPTGSHKAEIPASIAKRAEHVSPNGTHA